MLCVLSIVCQGEPARTNKWPNSSVKQVDQAEQQQAAKDYNNDFTLWTITGDHKEGYHVRLQIKGKHTQMELDTGATVSVILEQEWNQLFKSTQLERYVGGPL